LYCHLTQGFSLVVCSWLLYIEVIVDHHMYILIKIRSPHWHMFFAWPLDCDR
jgi:hypothetical protein